MSLFGGLCPIIISSLSVVLQPPTIAAGLVVVLTAVLSCMGGGLLVKVEPGTNAPCAAGTHVQGLPSNAAEDQKQRQKSMQLSVVVVV